MLSFSSALNRAGNDLRVANDADYHEIKSANSVLFDVSRIKAYNFNLNKEIKSELLQPENMNISNFFRYTNMLHVQNPSTVITGSHAKNMSDLLEWVSGDKTRQIYDKSSTAAAEQDKFETIQNNNNEKTFQATVFYEDANKLPGGLIQSMNRYSHVYTAPVNSVLNLGIHGEKTQTGYKAVEFETAKGDPTGKLANADTTNIYVNYAQTPVVSSIFNPIYMIQVMGMTENVPLLSNIYDLDTDIEIQYSQGQDAKNTNINKNRTEPTVLTKKINPLNGIVDPNLSNCTMRELVRKSHKHNSILGQARYKYADFMFCKDLGKVSNNHLITLRKFAHPVGDNIFRLTSPKFRTLSPNQAPDFDTEGDVGRLITWFGTEDNKLEDIAKFSVAASWKELEATIQALGEKADSAERSVSEINSSNAGGMGGIMTSNTDVTTGIETIIPNAPKMSEFTQQLIYAPMGVHLTTQSTKDKKEMLQAQNVAVYGSMAFGSDKNKIYTPKNTIQKTHAYEGKLTFEQEFTLNFAYKLRAYDNINPKSAFLDLLGNILEVTYRRGKFWGGSRSAVGPKAQGGGGGSHGGGGSGPAKSENIKDDNYDMLEGLARGLASGAIDWQTIMASISDLVNNIADTAKEMAQQIKDGWNANGILGAAGASILAFRDALSFLSDGLGGEEEGAGGSGGGGMGRGAGGAMAKQGGKPAVYAMDSLLKGDNVGLWHLTVGNPKNPIFVCGNLILTKATITHSGPLGIDDFPTELKVSCTLKHGRARDIIEISKMYTKGVNTIYNTVDRNKLSDFFQVAKSGVEQTLLQNRIITETATELDRLVKEQAALTSLEKEVIKAAKEEYNRQKEEENKQQEENTEEQKNNVKNNKSNKSSKSDKDGYKTTSTYISWANAKEINSKRISELQNLIKADEKLSGAIKITDDGGATLKDPKYNLSIYDSKLYDTSIYFDDEFNKEDNTEYINSASALRYETLGQDRDYVGRFVIDEIS